MKRNLILISFCTICGVFSYGNTNLIYNGNKTPENQNTGVVLRDTIVNGDTTIFHEVLEIDEHLVISDSVIIEKTIEKIKQLPAETKNDLGKFIVCVLVILFPVLSIYLKRRKNG